MYPSLLSPTCVQHHLMYIHVSKCLLDLIDHPNFQKTPLLPSTYPIAYKGECVTSSLPAIDTQSQTQQRFFERQEVGFLGFYLLGP